MLNPADENTRCDARERLIEAPCEQVYRMFSDPQHLARWWGPKGFSNTFREFDLRAGGYWRFTMHGPDGTDYPNESLFVEVTPGKRVVLEHGGDHHFFLTITFTAKGAHTLVGWRQVFDNVAHYQKIAAFVANANEENLDRLTAEVKRSALYPVLDSRFDLKLERIVDIPRELVWKAWTTPEHLLPWFCPLPWKTIACEIDLRPGGIFSATMQSPEGEQFPNLGCYLEIIPQQKLVWTDALHRGFRPAPAPVSGAHMYFTGMIILEDHDKGTKYTAICLHKDEEDRKKHAEMGFEQGWSVALDQLVAYMKKLI